MSPCHGHTGDHSVFILSGELLTSSVTQWRSER